ncbi:MAG: type I-MYXAN CRISPR-associated endonuclease Cas1 [Myxococcota bacterium]
MGVELVRVQALHALLYCERLFFLEEVEEVRVADASVFAGRRLHLEVDEGERASLELANEALGLRGKVDAVRRRDGVLLVTEQKRGRPAPGRDGPEAWETDRVQVAAYGMLVEAAFPATRIECRVRYHQPPALVPVTLDDAMRARVHAATARARELRDAGVRPPVTSDERRCARCSLAPVCLPREEQDGTEMTPRLFPEDDTRQLLHVATPGARIGRSAEQLKVTREDDSETRLGIKNVAAVVLHGNVQISAQALALCVDESVSVHWFRSSGEYLGGLGAQSGSVHRRLRQFEALRVAEMRLSLARRLVAAKVEGQLRFVLRASRERPEVRAGLIAEVRDLRNLLPKIRSAESIERLLGLEGAGAHRYFACLPSLLVPAVPEPLRWSGRSKHPPLDRVNALLSFFYGLVHREVEAALYAVGLDPAFGFYHRPRGSAGPLGLDLMELFRVPLADMPVLASINRGTWDVEEDFEVVRRAGAVMRVWLSASGRKKALEIFERRRRETWKHNVLGYSLSYGRLVELEVRLLEKEWTGHPGLFATFRLR